MPHIHGVRAVRFAATQALNKLERLERNVRARHDSVRQQVCDDITDIEAILHSLIGADTRENVPNARPKGDTPTERPRKPYTRKLGVPVGVVMVGSGRIQVEKVQHGLGRSEMVSNLVRDIRDQSRPAVSEVIELPIPPAINSLPNGQGSEVTGIQVSNVSRSGIALVRTLEHKDG